MRMDWSTPAAMTWQERWNPTRKDWSTPWLKWLNDPSVGLGQASTTARGGYQTWGKVHLPPLTFAKVRFPL
jgi:hypothetical protein